LVTCFLSVLAFEILCGGRAGAAFLACTPERLYARSGRQVASEAVAGTRPRGPPGDLEADFYQVGEPGLCQMQLCCNCNRAAHAVVDVCQQLRRVKLCLASEAMPGAPPRVPGNLEADFRGPPILFDSCGAAAAAAAALAWVILGF
jgi:hypothetical protein